MKFDGFSLQAIYKGRNFRRRHISFSYDHALKKSEASAKLPEEAYDVDKEVEEELEKELEGLDINDVDTTDVNLEDEDLLEDQYNKTS